MFKKLIEKLLLSFFKAIKRGWLWWKVHPLVQVFLLVILFIYKWGLRSSDKLPPGASDKIVSESHLEPAVLIFTNPSTHQMAQIISAHHYVVCLLVFLMILTCGYLIFSLSSLLFPFRSQLLLLCLICNGFIFEVGLLRTGSIKSFLKLHFNKSFPLKYLFFFIGRRCLLFFTHTWEKILMKKKVKRECGSV